MSRCLSNSHGNSIEEEVLVEVKQVMHPVCSTLRVFDIADTSVTNIGLLSILRKMPQLHSLGEFCISDNFLRGLCVVTSLKMDKFGLYTLHARKITNVGFYNMVHVFPFVRSFTCWEPQFDIVDLRYFSHLKHLTLLRIPFTETILRQILRYMECTNCPKSKGNIFNSNQLEKVCLEFVMQDEFGEAPRVAAALGFNLARVFGNCKGFASVQGGIQGWVAGYSTCWIQWNPLPT